MNFANNYLPAKQKERKKKNRINNQKKTCHKNTVRIMSNKLNCELIAFKLVN